MALSDYIYTPDMTEQQRTMMGLNMLSGALGGIANAARPGQIPANPLQVLAGGLGGGMQGYSGGLGQMMEQSKINQSNEQQRALSRINEQLQRGLERLNSSGNPMAQQGRQNIPVVGINQPVAQFGPASFSPWAPTPLNNPIYGR